MWGNPSGKQARFLEKYTVDRYADSFISRSRSIYEYQYLFIKIDINVSFPRISSIQAYCIVKKM